MWRLTGCEWPIGMTARLPSDRLQVRCRERQGTRIERRCQPLALVNVAASVALILLTLVIIAMRCGGDHYTARIWTVVAVAISGDVAIFGVMYYYLLGLWRCRAENRFLHAA